MNNVGALDEKGDPAVREYWTRIPDTRLNRGFRSRTPVGINHEAKFYQDPKFEYAFVVYSQSYGEPRVVPTYLY